MGRTAFPERPGQPYPATFHQWTHRGSNPDCQSAELVSFRWTMSPSQTSGPRGSRTLISGLRSRRRPVGPAAQSMIPDGLEPSLPGCRPGVVAAGPRDHRSCGGRIRTGVERLMRPCWKPSSSPLRSDQGESRTPTPVTARRSERRVSSRSTTWPISPYGNRTHPSGLRGRRPFADRRTGRSCVGQELNLHSATHLSFHSTRGKSNPQTITKV